MSKRTGWHEKLSVGTSGKGLVGHAGAVLLRRCADRVGLTSALGALFAPGRGPGWWDRGVVLVDLAVAITLGAVCLSDIGLLAHQAGVFGDPPLESTARRSLDGIDEAGLTRIAKARAVVRRHV